LSSQTELRRQSAPERNSTGRDRLHYSTSADADKDNNGKISTEEAFPYQPPMFAQFGYQAVARGQVVKFIFGADSCTPIVERKRSELAIKDFE
jgi:hypothetical protein